VRLFSKGTSLVSLMSYSLDVYTCISLNHDPRTCDHNHGKYILVLLFYHVHQLLAVALVFQLIVVVVLPSSRNASTRRERSHGQSRFRIAIGNRINVDPLFLCSIDVDVDVSILEVRRSSIMIP
jgi:hypothetical protein